MGGKVKGSAVKKVVIEVDGGVAYCIHKDKGVEVEIVDFDAVGENPSVGVFEASKQIGRKGR